MAAKKLPEWEKVTVYLTIATSLGLIFLYIADMKERTRALEVKVDHLEKTGD
ncbi:MAG TPA: hypothetical protein VMR37_05770 [Rhabdochlamydiaceae bacterium]|jgi:hypothetical protein|nr:hypothetical protein [Rhabdochlamydiaceae bacterium]